MSTADAKSCSISSGRIPLSLGEIAETLGFIKSQCRPADASQVVGAYFLARWAPKRVPDSASNLKLPNLLFGAMIIAFSPNDERYHQDMTPLST